MYIFQQTGKENTEQTLALAQTRAQELGLSTLVVATTSGRTGVMAAERFKDYQTVVVTHSTGFVQPGVQEAAPAHLEQIRAAGGIVLTTTHAFGGIGRSVRRKFKTYETEEIIAQTFRVFGQGTKVAVEISLMAADAGLVPMDRDIIAIGGTAQGADTALVLRAAHTQDFFDLKVREIICKPYL